jgi:hypothetical protein
MGGWHLESTTVHVTLEGCTRVEVSGVGQFTSCETFHAPPDTNINYRLRNNNSVGSWLTRKLDAGYMDWKL